MGAAARNERKLGRDLTEGPIFQSLLLFAMPIVAANIIQQLYGMVDLAVAGKYVGNIGTVGVNAGVNSYGTVASSANGVGNKILKICEVFMLSMDTSSGAMIAQNLGARKTKRAGRVCLCSLLLNLICAVLISVLGLAAAKEIFGLFSNDEQVMAIGVVFMEMMIIHFFSTAVVNAFQPMATGSGFVTLSFAVGILDGVICKVSFSLFFVPLFAAAEPGSLFYHFCEQLPTEMLAAGVSAGFLGYFFASACSRILPAILYIIYYASGKWKTRKLLTETK